MNFLIQSPHAWRSVWQRPHHLATRFARAGHAVRWVEPRYLRWSFSEPRRFFGARREVSPGGVEISPVTLMNGERLGPVRRYNKARLRDELLRPLRSASGGKRVLWLYNPHEGHLARSVPHDLLVYDIMDEYRGFPWSPRDIEREESELLARADWVFAGTQVLFDAKQPQAEGRIECVLSGVDAEHFSRAREGEPRVAQSPPADVAPLRDRYERLLGYAGMIDVRIDQGLLADAARRHPNWGWILLGPVSTDVSRLRSAPNIHLLGQKTYDELPAYYQSWDCALVPFVESDLTRHSNPTKMLEYAAAGLPILCRAIPDVERFYADGAFIYRTAEAFESLSDSILSGETNPTDRPDVKKKMNHAAQWARDRSWEAIAGRMLSRVETLLEKGAAEESDKEKATADKRR